MEDYQAKINKRLILITDENELDFRLQYNLDTEVNLNDTAKFIIKKCNENRSVNEIVELMIQKYQLSDNMRTTVYKDVISALTKLWNLGVIKWSGKIPNSDNYIEFHDNYKIRELSIQEDTDIFKKYSHFLWNSYTNLEMEKNLNMISMQLITKTTKFYKITDLYDKTNIYIALQFDDFSNQVIFKGIYCDEEDKILNFKVNNILKWIINREININNSSLSFLKEIPILFFSTNKKLSKILDFIKIKKIGLLKKEVNHGDIEVYITYVANEKI